MLPLKTMRCFADYDCAGQQLLNGAIILIDGARVTLQLDRRSDSNSSRAG
jgi:hypothetical protein